MKCNISSCNPFDDIHPTSFGAAPPLPPTSALVRILFAKLDSLKGVTIPQVAQRVSNFVGAAPSDDAIVDVCRDACSNETLDWISGHVWHKRPRWYQRACSAAAEGRRSQRVIDWVNAQVTPTGPEPLIVVQAVVAAKLGETRADNQTMLQVAQKISGHLVRLTSTNRILFVIAQKHPSIDQVERMVSHIRDIMTRSTYFQFLYACVQSGHTHLVKWAWARMQPRVDDQDRIQRILVQALSSYFRLCRPGVLETCSLLLKSCSDTLTSVGENFLSLLRRSVKTGICAVVKWTWNQCEDPAAYRLDIFMMIVSIVSSETLEEGDSRLGLTCQFAFGLSNGFFLTDYQIRFLSRERHYKALKWFIDREMTREYDLVFEFESCVIRDCEPIVQLLLGVIARLRFRYRLFGQLGMIRSSERRTRVEEYATAPDIVDKLCAVILNMSGFALMENVLKSCHERTPPSPLVPEIEKALAMQAARSNNLDFVRFAYRVLSSTICGEVLRPECTAHGNQEILSWLDRRDSHGAKRIRTH